MNAKKKIFRKCLSKGFHPKHVAEVGVYMPDTSNVIDYIEAGIRTTLVEANPEFVKKIQQRFEGYTHVTLYPKAVHHQPGMLTFFKRGASTFASDVKSPAMVNDQYQAQEEDKFEVEAVTFNTLDTGDIELLSIDIEGSEWSVLQHLKSRPAVISVETHGKYYTNPFLKEIKSWMATEGYCIWFKDKSDSVYVKPDIIKMGFLDRLQLFFYNIYLALRKFKGYLKKGIK